jgi:hypothetical protein
MGAIAAVPRRILRALLQVRTGFGAATVTGRWTGTCDRPLGAALSHRTGVALSVFALSVPYCLKRCRASSVLGGFAPATSVAGARKFGRAAYVPSFLHREERPYLYRGLGSKVAKTRSKGRPIPLSPRPFRGIKPAGGCSSKDLKQDPKQQKPEAKGAPSPYHHGPPGALSPLAGVATKI